MIPREPVSSIYLSARSLTIPAERQRRLQQVISQYARQIEDLSQQEFTPEIVQCISTIFDYFLKEPTPYQVNWRTQLAVEDMCTGTLSSSSDFAYALEESLKLLSKIQPELPKLKEALGYASYIQDVLQRPPIDISGISEEVKEKVAHLSIDETICLPVSNSEHAMILSITCTQIDTNGNKVFSISNHNTGDGIDYHYKKIEKNGYCRYQTDYTIEQIPAQTLCSPGSCFFQSLFSSPSITELYEQIIPSLKGKRAKPTQDLRHWNHEQIGDSCASGCVRVLLRSRMKNDDYKIFRLISRAETLLASFNDILNGRNDDSTQKRITLEMIHRLTRTCLKQNIQPPSGLDLMKTQLISSEESEVTPDSAPSSTRFIDNILQAHRYIVQYTVDASSLDTASSYIKEALKKKSHKLSSAEKHVLTSEIANIHRSFQEIPLTERQRYLLTALEATIQECLHQAKAHRKKLGADPFFQSMIVKYNALKLDQKSISEDYAVPAFNQIIKKYS